MVLARSSHHFFNLQQGSNSKVWRSLDSETNPPGPVIPARPPLFKTRSSSLPAPGTKKMDSGKSQARVGRGSVSNENNILLDPEVLTDYPTQVLVLTVLVCTLYFVFSQHFSYLTPAQCFDFSYLTPTQCFDNPANVLEAVLYTNIDQTLLNSLHGLLNCEISGLDCHAITKEYRTLFHCIHMLHLFCNALVRVISLAVSGQCSHIILGIICLSVQKSFKQNFSFLGEPIFIRFLHSCS